MSLTILVPVGAARYHPQVHAPSSLLDGKREDKEKNGYGEKWTGDGPKAAPLLG